MATYEITKVRTVHPVGAPHPHISEVELSNRVDQRFPRSVIVDDLRNLYGDRYYTFAAGTRADVVLGHCPHCGVGEYITTAPDWTRENNLLSLPRF
jgi:hypothetical protein